MTDEKGLTKASGERADYELDRRTSGKVIESIVVRGDLSGLSPEHRARYYVQMCEGLGLNPHSQPFAFLRLNGKEILYATRGATDQLAAMHRVNREIIDGPKVIDLAGTKMVYAVCKASMPNGRFETATATVPLVDPVNVLMKAETKAKRRATLSILGMGMLDEVEIESIPAGQQQPADQADLSQVHEASFDDEPKPEEKTGETTGTHPTALGGFYARIAEIELPGEAVSVWMKYRADLAPLPVADREAAWRSLCKRTEEVGRMKNAKVWLKKAIAEEDARRGSSQGDGPQDDPPSGGAGGSSAGSSNGTSRGSAVASGPASGPVGLVEDWMGSEATIRGYLSQRAHWNPLENAVRKHTRVIPSTLRVTFLRLAAHRLQTLSLAAVGETMELDGPHGCKAKVMQWADEGTLKEVAQRKAASTLTTATQLGMVA